MCIPGHAIRSRRFLAVAVAIATFTFTVGMASARGADFSKCGKGEPDARIANCTALIMQGGLTHKEVAAALDGRCWAYNLKSDYTAALADCNRSIEMRPDYPYAYDNLGVALEGLGRLDEALSNYAIAISLKPNFKSANENYTRLQTEMNSRRTPRKEENRNNNHPEPSPNSPACQKYPDLC